MCGINGKIYRNKETGVSPGLIRQMNNSLFHRGPDDSGSYLSGNIGLGHTRLSIIDLSGGRQPLANEDETVWVVFNGEIYNYKSLSQDLKAKGHIFKTETDTEVLVHLYEEKGEQMFAYLNGMFAFALWDSKQQLLLLARDRVGIKPLYYYSCAEFVVFASEIKAILQDPEVARSVDMSGLLRFLTCHYISAPETLFSNIKKLEAGHYLKVHEDRASIHQYWDLAFTEERCTDEKSQLEALTSLLEETVRDHMISDVPLGFFLSGGVDSTGLLSFASKQTQKTLYSFTIGFEGFDFHDERHYAQLAAKKFGTQHSEVSMTDHDFAELLPQYVWHMEEPVCEPPAIALFYLSRLAKDHVKVIVSGEGGDEGFAGYQNYRNLVWLEYLKQSMAPFRGLISTILVHLFTNMRSRKIAKYSAYLNLPLQSYYYSRSSNPFTFFNSKSSNIFSDQLVDEIARTNFERPFSRYFSNVASSSVLNQMLYVDTKTWLPDDLLLKADKMTMANSLEMRVPLLDHRVLEFAARTPPNRKLKGFTTKYLLKKALVSRVPAEIIRRKKTGFPVPYEAWISQQLGRYVEDILLDRRTLQRGYFNRKALEYLILNNRTDRGLAKEVFSLLVLELWHRFFIDQH